MNPSQICTRSIAALMACSILAVAAPSASAQTTATTDPVGFITLNIAGTGGAGANKVSFKGLGLTQPVAYQGSAETVNVAAKTFTDNEATWTEGQFNGSNGLYYLEIVRPTGQATAAPGEGTTYDVAATSASTKTITTVQALASGITNGAVFKIRKHWTIASAFGANNEAGLVGSDDPASADQLQLWNGVGFVSYFYQVTDPEFGGTGWRSPSNVNADAGLTPIYPDDGVVVRRIASAATNVVLMGAVKTGQSSFPIQAGVNIVSNVYAAPMTLQTSGLQASGFTGSDDPSSADQVLIWNGTGYDTFFYQITDPEFGGTGWRSPANVNADAGGTPIPVGSSVVVKRSFGPAFNWVIPQHPAVL